MPITMSGTFKERLERNIGWWSATCAVTGFTLGFCAYGAMLSATNQETVVKGTVLDKDVVERDYVRKRDKNADIQEDLSEQLLGSLLAYLSRFDNQAYRTANLDDPGPCITEADYPALRVDLLAYLHSGARAHRSAAILAYSLCAKGYVDAMHLALTVQTDDPVEVQRDYAIAIARIMETTSGTRREKRRYRASIRDYLKKSGAPEYLHHRVNLLFSMTSFGELDPTKADEINSIMKSRSDSIGRAFEALRKRGNTKTLMPERSESPREE